MSGVNPSSGSEQTKVVVTASALGDTCCQVFYFSNLHCWVKYSKVAFNEYFEA